jgi:hypothetical protein
LATELPDYSRTIRNSWEPPVENQLDRPEEIP